MIVTAVRHIPALVTEVVKGLAVRPGGRYIDGTVGGGGHAAAVLDASAPDGRLLGIDLDPEALAEAARTLAPYEDRVVLRRGSYADMASLAAGFAPVDGVLLDLGLSSLQLAGGRGFSFSEEAPLDMRFDPRQSMTASDLVNQASEGDLARLVWEYGEEPRSRRIARRIVAKRPLATTTELARVVAEAVGRPKGPRHPATRTFQALRIAVNDELRNLEAGLTASLRVLASGGRLAVIAYHSLEDRIVKGFLAREARACICPPEVYPCQCGHVPHLRPLTRRPLRPSRDEVVANPRSRSARLRLAERLLTA